jgi:hypothetical protein
MSGAILAGGGDHGVAGAGDFRHCEGDFKRPRISGPGQNRAPLMWTSTIGSYIVVEMYWLKPPCIIIKVTNVFQQLFQLNKVYCI